MPNGVSGVRERKRVRQREKHRINASPVRQRSSGIKARNSRRENSEMANADNNIG